MVTAETKIFSVAVQAGKTEGSASRNPPLRDVEGQMVDRPVILSISSRLGNNETGTKATRERHCSDDEFKPAQREAMEPPEVEAVPEETFVIEEKVQEEQPVVTETKKQKKNKKKGKNPEPMTCSSADEMKEVEVKPKKKKNKKEKTPEPELIVHRPDETKTKPVVEQDKNKEKTETEEIFEEFVAKDEISYPDDFSPDKDLVEFSESEEKVIEIDEDQDDSEKVDFFIREKSSSVESDDLRVASSTIDETAAKPNPWFNKFLQKSSSLIEDQIFGAAKKYETEEKMDEDEDMMELEMNQTNVETNIAALLEDDEVVSEEPKSERRLGDGINRNSANASVNTAVKMDSKPFLLLLLLDFLLLEGRAELNRVAHFAISAPTLGSNILQTAGAARQCNVFCPQSLLQGPNASWNIATTRPSLVGSHSSIGNPTSKNYGMAWSLTVQV